MKVADTFKGGIAHTLQTTLDLYHEVKAEDGFACFACAFEMEHDLFHGPYAPPRRSLVNEDEDEFSEMADWDVYQETEHRLGQR